MAYDGLWKYASFLFLTLGLCYILQKYSMLRNYFWPLNLGVLAISAFFYLIQMQQENWNLPGRFSFPFGNPTVAGTVLGFGCAIAAGLGIAKFKQKQWAYASFYTCLAALFGCVLFLAKAKAAMIATIAALLYLFIRTYPRIGLAFLFLMVLGCSISYEAWMSSIAPSLEIRLWIWQDTWKMILDNPWRCCVGFGPGNFIACFPKFQSPSFFAAFYSAEIVESPHNICLEVWSEFGLIGLLLLVGFLFQTIRQAWKSGLEDHYILIAGLCVLLLDAQCSVSFTYWQAFCLMAWMIAWAAHGSMPAQPIQHSMVERPAWAKYLAFLMLLVLPILWKIAVWDIGTFHQAYKAAIREPMPEMRSKLMVSIPLPRWESMATLQWRCDLGAVLNDVYPQDPEWVDEHIQAFLFLDRIPQFGEFGLYRAFLFFQMGHWQPATASLVQFSQHNPFSPNLWMWWAQMCRNPAMSTQMLFKTSAQYHAAYPNDPAPLFALGLAQHLLGRPEQAKSLMSQAMSQAQSRLQQCSNHRDRTLLYWTQEYLEKTKPK